MRKKNRIWAVLTAAVITVGALAGCGSSGSSASTVSTGSTASSEKSSADTVQEASSQTASTADASSEADSTVSLGHKATTVHIGYQGTASYAWLDKKYHYLEDELGKQGVKVSWDQFLSGPPMVESMAAGGTDIGMMGDMPPINARGQGIDIKIISKSGNLASSNTLVVGKNSGIKKVEDLKGKKVATQVGSSGHHFLALILNRAGLSMKDIQLVNLSAADGINALASGQVDAMTTWEPFGSQAVNKGAGTILLDSTGIKQNTSTYVTTEKFAQDNPGIIVTYLKVWLKYVDLIKADPDAALKVIADGSGFNPDDIRASVTKADYSVEFTDYDYKQEKLTKDFLLSTNTLKHDFNINDLYDFKYIKEAEKEYNAEK